MFGTQSTFVRCRDCATLIDLDPPSADEIAELYRGSEYFVKDGSTFRGDGAGLGYSEDYLAEQPLIEAKFDRVLGHVERYAAPGRLLDIGCGPGFLVSAAQKRGWKATGVDVNEWATAWGRERLGLDLVTGEVDEDTFVPATFDAITMMDVIEHVPDPDVLLKIANRLLRPGGALALLTPNAASLPSRMLGRRWPEARRPGEHLVLFSVDGLRAAVTRNGLVASGWHSIGKIAPVGTLLADVEGVAPGPTRWVANRLSDSARSKVVHFDPRTKFVLYARKPAGQPEAERHMPARLPRDPEDLAAVDRAILEELHSLAAATNYREWLYDAFGGHVNDGRVLEVGAGVGTFTAMMLERGATEVVAVEPEERCAAVLDDRFADDARVSIVREFLPDAPTVAARPGEFDLVVCQNVLEHIDDDVAALVSMRGALRSGGRLVLIVPSDPRLFGALDDAYGHWRRYTSERLQDVVTRAGMDVTELRPINSFGRVGWWANAKRPGARVGAGSLQLFDRTVPFLRRWEERRSPKAGLSLVCAAVKPDGEAA